MALTGFFGRSRPAPAPSVPDSVADALVEGYVAWREASSDVRAAYERWTRSEGPDRDPAFTGYLAALEQEEHAARVYERRIDVVQRWARATKERAGL